MKKLILFAVLISFFAGNQLMAQTMPKMPYDSVTKKIDYTDVVKVNGADKNKLYDRAMAFLRSYWKDFDAKLTTNDKTGGTIVYNGYTRIMLKDKKGNLIADPSLMKFKMAIYFKDGRYKYEVYDLHIDKGGYKQTAEQLYTNDHTITAADRAEEKLTYVDQDIRAMLEKFVKALESDKQETKSDW
jgi:hypothetical protein